MGVPSRSGQLAGVVLREALFEPGIGIVRIAAHFPEAKDVAVDKGDFADELGAFPGVFFRNDDARGTTMLDGDGLSVNLVRDEDVIVQADIERVVRGIAVVALEENEFRGGPGPDQLSEGEKGDALPVHFVFGPGGDAMEVAHVPELGQGVELVPTEGDRVFDLAVNLELPLVEGHFGMDAEVQHGPVLDEFLAGR